MRSFVAALEVGRDKTVEDRRQRIFACSLGVAQPRSPSKDPNFGCDEARRKAPCAPGHDVPIVDVHDEDDGLVDGGVAPSGDVASLLVRATRHAFPDRVVMPLFWPL